MGVSQNTLHADEHEVVVAGTEIPGVFDGITSPYHKIFTALSKGNPYAVELKMMPPLRTLHVLLDRSADCLFIGGANAQSYIDRGMPADKVLISNIIHRTKLKVFTRPSEPAVRSVADLDGKFMALDITSGPVERFQRDVFRNTVELLPAQTAEQAIAMLLQNRVQAAAVYDVDMMLWQARNPEKSMFGVDQAFSVKENNETMLCWRSPTTEAFVEHVNSQIPLLNESGMLDSVFSDVVD